ncbi:MAG: hypothetical protein MK212_17120 [Saprospiraceae bacterium]|nr:hypothetical protein [Saprospiraceae bacterium]
MFKQLLFLLAVASIFIACEGDLTRGTGEPNPDVKGTEGDNISENSTVNNQPKQDALLTLVNSKMNVLYIGVDNPIDIKTTGIAADDLRLSIAGGSAMRGNQGWSVQVQKTGKVILRVSHPNEGDFEFPFEARRVPTPFVSLYEEGAAADMNLISGMKKIDFMKAQKGLVATIENFDYECTCSIESYDFYYIPENGKKIKLQGKGSQFTEEIKNIIDTKLKGGDALAFQNMQVRCPGDQESRRTNGLNFIIR